MNNGHAVGGSGRGRGTRDAAHRAHTRRPGPNAAVMRVRMIRNGGPSVGR